MRQQFSFGSKTIEAMRPAKLIVVKHAFLLFGPPWPELPIGGVHPVHLYPVPNRVDLRTTASPARSATSTTTDYSN